MIIKKVLKFLNKPLPKGVCEALGKGKACKVAWPYVILLTTVITVMVNLPAGTLDTRKPLPTCVPDKSSVS